MQNLKKRNSLFHVFPAHWARFVGLIPLEKTLGMEILVTALGHLTPLIVNDMLAHLLVPAHVLVLLPSMDEVDLQLRLASQRVTANYTVV